MIIQRNNDIEQKITQQVQDTWIAQERDRHSIHLSDLLAPRKAYFQRILHKPPSITEILYYISGLGIEEKLTRLLGERHVRARTRLGISYSPDLCLDISPDLGILLTEVKSRRRALPENNEEAIKETFDYYLAQLSGYCALDHKNNGLLLVLSLAEKVDDSYKTEPVLASYLVEYTKRELKERRKELAHLRELLGTALRTKTGGDFDELPQCPKWMCGREIKTMVVVPHCTTCNKDFATDWGAKKHKEGKKTNTHDVVFAEYEYNFEPTCKYFNPCNGIE